MQPRAYGGLALAHSTRLYLLYLNKFMQEGLFFLFFSSVTSFSSSARASSASLFSHGTIAHSIDYCE